MVTKIKNNQNKAPITIASHGYVADKESLIFVNATHAYEKHYGTPKSTNGVVWPRSEKLWEAPNIGYSHLEEVNNDHVAE